MSSSYSSTTTPHTREEVEQKMTEQERERRRRLRRTRKEQRLYSESDLRDDLALIEQTVDSINAHASNIKKNRSTPQNDADIVRALRTYMMTYPPPHPIFCETHPIHCALIVFELQLNEFLGILQSIEPTSDSDYANIAVLQQKIENTIKLVCDLKI